MFILAHQVQKVIVHIEYRLQDPMEEKPSLLSATWKYYSSWWLITVIRMMGVKHCSRHHWSVWLPLWSTTVQHLISHKAACVVRQIIFVPYCFRGFVFPFNCCKILTMAFVKSVITCMYYQWYWCTISNW